jgi:thioredoxin reductase (NADPH)
MEEATYLSKFASTIYLVHRRDTFRASKVMLERARSNPKIQFVVNSQVDEVIGGSEREGVVAVRIKSTVDGSLRDLAVTGMFLAIGHTPNVAFLEARGVAVQVGLARLSDV